MIIRSRAALALLVPGLFLLTSCGKVGEPLPPSIRIPKAIGDFAVRQSGHTLVLTWTNPAKNIDESTATDLARVHIRSNDSVIAMPNVNGPGRPQSYEIPVGAVAGNQRTYLVQIETSRGRLSGTSNVASVVPVEVPGRITGLRGVADQRRITLQWQRPQDHPELADAYLVNRSEPPDEGRIVSETRYEDPEYQPGKSYTYQVMAVRRAEPGVVPGDGSMQITVAGEDKVPPRVPSGLDAIPADMGGFLTWLANTETDMAGYRVYRSERADGDFMPITDRLNATNAFFDGGYRSGLYYEVSAVDDSGNESARSAPFRAP